MTRRVAFAAKLAASVGTAIVSGQLMFYYWLVGPIFGMVVVAWRARSTRALLAPRSVAFLVAATFTYALVLHLSDPQTAIDGMIRRLQGEAFDTRTLSITWTVAAGTVLLPVAQTLLLGEPWRRTALAIPSIYAIWYLSMLVWPGIQAWPSSILSYPVIVWQGAYLLCMVSPLLDRCWAPAPLPAFRHIFAGHPRPQGG